MFESRSIASLSRSGISVHTRANLFYNPLLLFGLMQQSAPRLPLLPLPQQKSNVETKGKQIRCMEKRKQTENGKTPGSEQPVVKIERLWLTYDEVKSGIGDHRTSLDAQPASWRKLRTMKGSLCMSTASRSLHRQRRAKAKLMEPDL